MLESKVEGYLKKQVEAAGGVIRKVQWLGRRGAPDRWCGFPRSKRAAWVELKRPLTPNAEAHQAREHQRLLNCGETVCVLASIEAVDAFIREMTR